MTSAERAQVLEVARKLCLEVAEDQRKLAAESQKYGHNAPGFNQDLGAVTGAALCAEAIKEEAERG
jgi:hypothetical protein